MPCQMASAEAAGGCGCPVFLWELPINITTMADAIDGDAMLRVINSKQHAVVSYSKTISTAAFKLLDMVAPWLTCELFNMLQNVEALKLWQATQIFFNPRIVSEAIGQLEQSSLFQASHQFTMRNCSTAGLNSPLQYSCISSIFSHPQQLLIIQERQNHRGRFAMLVHDKLLWHRLCAHLSSIPQAIRFVNEAICGTLRAEG